MKNHLYKKRKILRPTLFILGVFALCSSITTLMPTQTAHAQSQVNSDYTLLSPLPCLGNVCPSYNSGNTANFQYYVKYAFNLFIALAAVTAVFMIVYGGFEYVTSTIPGNKEDGKKKIEGALWGLILVLASFLIIRTINPQLVQIPATLVPQITLPSNLATNNSSDFISQLNNESTQFANQNHAASVASVAARDDAARAQTNLDAVNQQINKNMNPPLDDDDMDEFCSGAQSDSSDKYDKLCVQRSSYMNQIATDNSIQASQSLNASFSTALQNATNDASTANPENLQQAKSTLDIAYNTLRPSVTDPIQQQAVDNQYKYATGKLDVLTYYQQADVHNDASISAGIANIQKVQDTVVPQITDPTEKANLTQSAISAKAQLQSYLDISNEPTTVYGP